MDRLLSQTTDTSLLMSRFEEFLEMEDVRYYVMSSVRENVAKVMERNRGVRERRQLFDTGPSSDAFFFMCCCSQAALPVYQCNVFTLMSKISVPSQDSELTNFMVKQEGERCCFTS